MRDHDDGRSVLAIDPCQEFQDAVGCFVVKIAGRFVREDNLGFVQEGTGDRDPLLFPAGKLVGHFVGLVNHPYILQHFQNPFVDRGPIFPSGCLQHEFKVFFHCPVHQQLEILENNPEFPPQIGDVAILDSFELEAADLSGSLSKRILPGDRADDGGLAGADLAYDVDEIPREDLHVKVVDDRGLSVENVRAAKKDNRLVF